MSLLLKITRTSPTHHRLEYTRADGGHESADIETKSFLQHDFLHYALEVETGVHTGFFGLLAAGYTLAELGNKVSADFDRDSAMQVERAVGGLTGLIKGASPEDVMTGLQNIYNAEGRPLPEWLTADVLERAAERYRRINGKWNSLKFGETLELVFEG